MMIEKEEAEFSLTEVEALTGFPRETVRAWRKRGYLSPQNAYAKVTLREVASLALRKHLLNHGFGLTDARDLADRYAAMIAYIAILDTPGSCEVRGTAGALDAFEDQWGADDELARELTGCSEPTVTMLVSYDESELSPDVSFDVDQDSLTGYYINLMGLARQLGAMIEKPLFKVRVARDEDQGRVQVRRIPRIAGGGRSTS